MLLALAALAVGGYIAWDLFGPSDRDPNKPLPSIPEPSEHLAPPVMARAASITVPATGRVIFWAGDSLTTAKPWRLVKVPGAKLDGQGWSGETISSVVKHAFPLVVKAHATDVVLRAGVNDAIADHPAERIEADLAAGWQKLQDAGVRVWAGLLTPWAGHKKSTAARQAVTRAVNEWIRAQVGKSGGPVAAIDADTLGDDAGKLRAELSGDGLHMKQVGYVALTALDALALTHGGTEMQTTATVGVFTAEMFDGLCVGGEDAVVGGEADLEPWSGDARIYDYDSIRSVAVGDEGDIQWPPGWRPAPQNVVDAVNEASAKFGVPRDIILSILWKESRFNPKLVGYKNATTDTSSKAYSKTFRASYERNKDLRIPGSSMTWGEMFPDPTRWTAIGICQLLNFNLVGKRYGVKAGAPWSSLFDVRTQILCCGDLLKTLYDKYGDWPTAILRYNGASSYRREVLGYVDALKAAQAA